MAALVKEKQQMAVLPRRGGGGRFTHNILYYSIPYLKKGRIKVYETLILSSFVSVKLGRLSYGKNIDWGSLRLGCSGEYWGSESNVGMDICIRGLSKKYPTLGREKKVLYLGGYNT
jgi:hypothetical protein